MPLEIRELIIRVTVNEKGKGSLDENLLNDKIQELKAKVVKECIDKIATRMESLNER
ncbi:MAG: DUF5908 family protein [Bacteroidota bacterium]